jgi:hypothetical protein
MAKSSKGRGQLSAMPVMRSRPALRKVSEARVNGSTERAAGPYKSK